MDSYGIRLSAVLTALGYSVLVFMLMGGVDLVGLWAISPLAVPLATAFFAQKKLPQLVALSLLLFLAIGGAPLLIWGLAWNPGDYNHLIVLFLPLYQFAFLAVALAILACAKLMRRFGRRA
ncbi:hypothetical protein [Sphingomonas sp.]|uniref:hypothetical protein n=1 Tax=Sphingomonas sp. TaxID=28214 RepID=UPI00286C598B|nr:hypothetical protein [Sphingomonas sp.]